MGARDLFANLAAIGVTVTVQGSNLLVRPWSLVSAELRQAVRAAKPSLIELLNGPKRPYRLTVAEMDVAHDRSWDDPAIARFEARAEHLQRLGFTGQDAEDLAERLHLRDVTGDRCRGCFECGHYRSGRCANHRVAALTSPEIGTTMATLFQNCPGFAPLKDPSK